MNLSGLSVAALAAEFEIDTARDLLVLYDELDLPLGVVRVRERGSAAGHNGARSISGALRSDEWARIRIGVGSNGEPEEAFRRGKDYLLTPLRKKDLATLDEVLDRVAWIRRGACCWWWGSGIRASNTSSRRTTQAFSQWTVSPIRIARLWLTAVGAH